MSIPRFSAILATRKCKTNNTQSESFENITVGVQAYLDDKEKTSALSIRKMSVFVEEGLAWGNWQETTR